MLTIKQRQMNLNFLNYGTGGIDGIEGSKTRKAYRDFQEDFNLKLKDGIYGKETETKLITIIEEIQEIVGANIDGVAGEETKEMTKIYQAKNNLDIDGIAGVNTRYTMFVNDGWNTIKHFKKEEFTCKDGCGSNNIKLELVKIADKLREDFGNIVIVTSGTRCKKHNKEVGGVSNSRHLTGKAMDFYVKGVSGIELLKYTEQLQKEGKIRYTYLIKGTNAVHMDIL